jgi:hypothetical protein
MQTTALFVNAAQPTVFQKLLKPVAAFVKEQNHRLPKPPNQKYEYEDFFRLLIYYVVSGTASLKLLIKTRLNAGLLTPALGLRPVPYSTCQDAFERFSPRLFQAVFQHLLSSVSFKAVPELAALGTLYCMDGSLFPVISSMLWAEYTTKHQALKLHLCFKLNRMIPVNFWVGSGHSSERDALRTLLATGVTYIADRGYLSFQLGHEVCQAQAHFIFRAKTNLVLTVVESLPISLPAPAQGLFSQLSDELIRYNKERPGYVVFAVDRFNIVSAGAVDTTKFTHPELCAGIFSGPKMIYAQPPTDIKERSELLASVLSGGPDLEGHPQYYQSFADHTEEVLARACPATLLYDGSDEQRETMQAFAIQHNVALESLRFLPLVGKHKDMTMLLQAESGAVLGAVDMDPWKSGGGQNPLSSS